MTKSGASPKENAPGTQLEADFETFGNYFSDKMASFREIRAADTGNNIRKFSQHDASNRVLEVGCGDGAVLQFLGNNGFGKELFGLDVSNAGIATARQRDIPNLKELGLFNGYDIPYPDKHFDLVILPLVLEYVAEPRRLLKEMARVGKKLYIQVQLYDVITKNDYVPDEFHTLNWYTARSFQLQLQSSGLQILKIRTHNPSKDIYSLLNNNHFVGTFKWLLKESALTLVPGVARMFWNYQCAAICVPKSLNKL